MSLAAECARQLRHSTVGRPPQRRRGRRNRHPYAPAVRADGAPINFRRASELWSGIVDRRDDEYGPDTVVASVALSCESPGRPAPPVRSASAKWGFSRCRDRGLPQSSPCRLRS